MSALANASRPDLVARETDPSGVAARASRETNQDPEAAPVSRETGQSLPARALLAPLRAYRRWISPLLQPRCRYYPTCSAYAEQAITELGVRRGLIVGLWRLLRCNPFSSGGLDPIENRRLFRSEGTDHSSDIHEAHA